MVGHGVEGGQSWGWNPDLRHASLLSYIPAPVSLSQVDYHPGSLRVTVAGPAKNQIAQSLRTRRNNKPGKVLDSNYENESEISECSLRNESNLIWRRKL